MFLVLLRDKREMKVLHVSERAALKHISSKHLADGLNVELETSDTHLSTEEKHTEKS